MTMGRKSHDPIAFNVEDTIRSKQKIDEAFLLTRLIDLISKAGVISPENLMTAVNTLEDQLSPLDDTYKKRIALINFKINKKIDEIKKSDNYLVDSKVSALEHTRTRLKLRELNALMQRKGFKKERIAMIVEDEPDIEDVISNENT